MLADIVGSWLSASGWDYTVSANGAALFSLLLALPEKASLLDWRKLLARPDAERLLDVHLFEDTLWFRKESLEAFTSAAAVVLRLNGTRPPRMRALLDAAQTAAYRWERFISVLPSPARKPSRGASPER